VKRKLRMVIHWGGSGGLCKKQETRSGKKVGGAERLEKSRERLKTRGKSGVTQGQKGVKGAVTHCLCRSW